MLRAAMLLLALHCTFVTAFAQNPHLLTGQILDAQTGEPIPFASCQYKGHSIGMVSDIEGNYSTARHNGWTLTFSAVGYVSQTIMVSSSAKNIVRVRLQPDNKVLKEVTVKAKRGRYSRKNNPAVEMMKKVVAAKKRTDLENRDFYQYTKYQKITLALNDFKPEVLDSPIYKKKQWLIDQIETCPYNNKLILPVSVDETVSQKIYRKHPHDEKTIVKGMNTSGINDLIQTGDILNTIIKDVFTDVNIYDDQIRMLQYPFTSPIGKDAIAFYRFYIQDTLMVQGDKCFHLHFLPNNQQDFGFRGDLYILADSSWQVKRCEMTIPKKSDVNFVENMQVVQEFTRLPDGDWVLSVDDMFTEIKLASFLQKFAVIRNTRLTDYAFDELPRQLFKGIVGGTARAGFDGLIYVAPDAQKTQAFQENHTLLLSDTARTESRPQLEIYADDVQCSHGATTGYLNPDELFYLRSRGIPEAEARQLQMQAFLAPVVRRLPDALAEEIHASLS